MKTLEVIVSKGVFLGYNSLSIAFDPLMLPTGKPAVTLVSHAHQDHYSPSVLRKLSQKTHILMSPATRRIIDPARRLKNIIEVNPGETLEVEGLGIEAFHSGHIIGSLQFRVVIGDLTVVYTGDFNLERRVVLQPAKPLKGDVVLIDATYGSPDYVFPERKEIYAKIISILKEREGDEVVLKARRLGVAQEVTALLSMSTHIPVIVESEIAKYNEVYEEFGEILGRYAISNTPKQGFPLVARLSRKFPKKVFTLSLTGWAVKTGVPLSSHGDFRQLVEYVTASESQVVIPVCGFRKEFSEYVKEILGITASSDDKINIRL
ncbi:MBL fold metallo-hydrolase [Infirmifilum sp. NZ]|uniref:MBL fold metallo-hydrolase n=1 Tax=Infirmifilum sp. NZ TaxID=2926850 RepID=UPI0027A4F487|nr:MBL fold metallo-hydrolase [Infirmifilum sp. NZ]UNQ72675.1 MBL fold metallo-hydrolase [Infirmifilum sp. NZ]